MTERKKLVGVDAADTTIGEALGHVINILYRQLFGVSTSVDPLFQRYIDLGVGDKEIMSSVKQVFQSWNLIYVMWVSVTTPSVFTIPAYIVKEPQLTIYKVCIGVSVVTGIMALYIGVRKPYLFI